MNNGKTHSPIRSAVTVGNYDRHPPAHQSKNISGILAQDNEENYVRITKKKKAETWSICTLNTRTLRTEESLTELEQALEEIKWDIIGISEMRRVGEAIEERENFIMYYKGETAGHRGVGFIIKPYLKNSVKELNGISERIAVLVMKVPYYNKEWAIIQVYAPTEQADKNETDLFYNNLQETLIKYDKHYVVIIGDFNAQVGTKQSESEFVIGKFGHGKRSKNGQKLVDFLLQNNLTLLNSIFKKKSAHKWTWISPDGRYKNEIDFAMTNHPKAFNDTSVVKNLNFNTNHRMVRSFLRLDPPKKSRRNFTSYYDSRTVENPKQVYPLQQLYTRAKDNTEDPTMIYTLLESTLAQQSVKTKTYSTKVVLENEVSQLLEERKNLIAANKHSKEHQKRINSLSNNIREKLRKQRKIKRLQTLENHILQTGGIKKALKELREEGKEWIPKMKKGNHNMTKRQDIGKLATDFYRALYADDKIQHCSSSTLKPLEEPAILTSEVEKAIKSQKLNKAPGPDKIRNELLRGTMEEICPILAQIFSNVMNSGNIPEQWFQSHIILIHKKGDKGDISNYRPISLMSNVYKLFAKVILERISTNLDESQPVEQAGFRKDFSTIDHIHTIKQIMEKYNEYGKPLYIAFIDYTKAFDSIYHKYIWESLELQGISPVYIKVLKNIYSNSKAKVQLEKLGEEFPVNRGVRQGDPLSPKLFSAVLEEIFRNLNWEQLGLNIYGTRLNHLRFADDIVLLEENPENLQTMICELAHQSKKVGLEMNSSKTKVMTNSSEVGIKVEDKQLQYVKEYVYLGQIISPQDQTMKEINKRIAMGWKKYWSLKEVMKSRDISLATKRKLFNTCILPILCYGCETWALNKFHRNRLKTCQRAMERSVLFLKRQDRVSSVAINTKTKFADVLKHIDQKKWRWTGHMLRNKIDKWNKRVTVWLPKNGKRRRGRQTRRWEDELRLTAGPYWLRAALDRRHWRELEEAFARRHSELRDLI